MLARVVSVPIVAVTVLAGVWVTGGLLTNDFHASLVLTGLWFALSGVAALAVALRRRDLRWPVLGAYALTAAAISLVLGLGTLRSRVADDALAAGAAVSTATFVSEEHATAGTAAVVRTSGGRRVLQLTGFETSAGPDLRLRAVPGDSADGDAEGAVDLGALKGNRGDQQYALPDGVAQDGTWTFVVWCRAFSVAFGRATLV